MIIFEIYIIIDFVIYLPSDKSGQRHEVPDNKGAELEITNIISFIKNWPMGKLQILQTLLKMAY